MQDNDHFNQLLNRYLSSDGTDKEYQELMRLIRLGVYDEVLRARIDSALSANDGKEDMSVERAQNILQFILEKEETEKVIPIERSFKWHWVAAAAIVVVGVCIGWYAQLRETSSSSDSVAKTETIKLRPAVFTGKQFVHLPDNSTVVLNEGGELRYNETFGQDVREVELKGEAYFDIQHNPAKPFLVRTGSVTTTVLGTAFNVKAYPGQKISVTVTRGKVQVSNKEKTLGIITPDQQITVNTNSNTFSQINLKEEQTEKAMAWKSQYMILDDVSLETAAAIVEERYNAKIIFDNPKIKNCRITAMFLNGENLAQVITVISGVINVQFEKQSDGNIRLFGEGCSE